MISSDPARPPARPRSPVPSGREHGHGWIAEENLIDRLLADQQRLQTPAALFARQKDAGLRTDLFRHLIPLDKPKPGEQYAFQVDLDKCSGCKACVSACHSLNGLDDHEAWRDVGLLLGERGGLPIQQTITTACHHCLEPACAHGCPVLAYEKDEATGIVRHLDDQCIGCSYCILKCPYDVPKFSPARGIVRKCDMCHGRLTAGEAPACVQACPHEAIRIVTVSPHEVADRSVQPLVPGAFDSGYTIPTTQYVRRMPSPGGAGQELKPADAAALRVEDAHWPLAFMLVFTQAALGLSCAAWMHDAAALWAAAFLLAALGGAASVLHLGQPLKAWRVFLGLRRSWLSREVVLFGPWAGALALAASLALAPDFFPLPAAVGKLAGGAAQAAALVLGGLTVLCSMMVYIDTRRPLWSPLRTSLRFGSTVLLGWAAGLGLTQAPGAIAFPALLAAKLLLEAAVLARWFRSAPETPEARSAGTTLHLLPGTAAFRALTLLAAIALAGVHPLAALVLCLASEYAERRLFFQACPAPRMPGL